MFWLVSMEGYLSWYCKRQYDTTAEKLPEASHVNYSFAPIPISLWDITSNQIHPPGPATNYHYNQLVRRFHGSVYSDAHYSRKTCVFNSVSALRCGDAAALLMTPVPCNFFSVTNSDYRVGVELGAKHHLFSLLFFFSLTRAQQLCVCLNSRFRRSKCLTPKWFSTDHRARAARGYWFSMHC